MPYKKTYRKRRPRRIRRRSPKLKISRNIGLKPATHFFKRRVQYTINPSNADTFPGGMGYTNDGAIYWNTAFALNELPSYTDFTNLFASYKINAVNVCITPHVSTTSWGTAESLKIRTKWNQTGRAFGQTITEDDMLQMQAIKTHVLPKANNKPINMYMKVRQLSHVYETVVTTGYASVRPRYISCEEPQVSHEGTFIYINTLSDTAFASNVAVPFLNIVITYYVACKSVM